MKGDEAPAIVDFALCTSKTPMIEYNYTHVHQRKDNFSSSGRDMLNTLITQSSSGDGFFATELDRQDCIIWNLASGYARDRTTPENTEPRARSIILLLAHNGCTRLSQAPPCAPYVPGKTCGKRSLQQNTSPYGSHMTLIAILEIRRIIFRFRFADSLQAFPSPA